MEIYFKKQATREKLLILYKTDGFWEYSTYMCAYWPSRKDKNKEEAYHELHSFNDKPSFVDSDGTMMWHKHGRLFKHVDD